MSGNYDHLKFPFWFFEPFPKFCFMHLKCLKIGEFAKTWLVKICTTLRSCPKGGYPTPHLPFMYNIGNNKELPLPHPLVPENQRCCGGIHCGNGRCPSERRANGWLKSGRRDRDRGPIAPVPLLVGRPIFCSQATDEVFQSSNCRCIFTWAHVFQSSVNVLLFLMQVDKV